MGVAFAPTEGGGRGAADPRVGANVTRPRFVWQAQEVGKDRFPAVTVSPNILFKQLPRRCAC